MASRPLGPYRSLNAHCTLNPINLDCQNGEVLDALFPTVPRRNYIPHQGAPPRQRGRPPVHPLCGEMQRPAQFRLFATRARLRSLPVSSSWRPHKTAAGEPGPRLRLIETRFPVAAHARGHNLEFGAPVQRRLVQGVVTTSSGRALRRTDVPRRSYSTSSSYSSS